MERGVNDGIVRDEIRIADAQVNDVIVAGQCLGIKAQTGVNAAEALFTRGITVEPLGMT